LFTISSYLKISLHLYQEKTLYITKTDGAKPTATFSACKISGATKKHGRKIDYIPLIKKTPYEKRQQQPISDDYGINNKSNKVSDRKTKSGKDATNKSDDGLESCDSGFDCIFNVSSIC